METYIVPEDIGLICVTASSFPEGIKAAFDQLNALLPYIEGREFFGISYAEKTGEITYKAAVREISPDEARQVGGERLVLPKGNYLSLLIPDFEDHIPEMGATFRAMCADPRIDRNGVCVEMYEGSTDVRCMVRLAD